MFVKLAVKTNKRREKVGKNVIFALHIKTYIYTVKHKLQVMVPTPRHDLSKEKPIHWPKLGL